ncbi:12470_t:CDS:2 [Ambispora gerdemannii]|uniref:12470_t:CDS:1 n=1 Tax=Ambispora gerdemannii TaxID=144530 RepID=A0A9N9FR77_9GLOM|nr:12470_t:CDS:2 [Ambispora gerdemannii]
MVPDTTFKRDLSKELLEIFIKGYENDRVIQVEVNEWFKTHSEPPAQIFQMIFERSNDETDYKTLLAFMYCLGIGTEIDKCETFRYYLTAAEQGDPAIYWYRRAFDCGDTEYSKEQLYYVFLKND